VKHLFYSAAVLFFASQLPSTSRTHHLSGYLTFLPSFLPSFLNPCGRARCSFEQQTSRTRESVAV